MEGMAPNSKPAESSKGRKNSKAVAGVLRSGPGGDPSVPTRNTHQAKFNPLEKPATAKKTFRKDCHQGEVVYVDYGKSYGFLVQCGDDGAKARVYFRVSPPGNELTSILTGGMLLIPGDIMEYELANYEDSQKPRVAFARLCTCKPRKADELVKYVESLVASAKEHSESVLRDVTRCPTGFKLVLDFRNPPEKLLEHTLELCRILTSSKQAGLYHSRLKQMYALLGGSRFLLSEDGVGKLCASQSRTIVCEQNLRDPLKGFVIHLLEYCPSQLMLLLPVLARLGACTLKSKISHSSDSDKSDSPCEAESFFKKVLNVLAGRNFEEPGSQPWSQLPLLPTMVEVRSMLSRDRSTLPVVKQTEPYSSPEDYVDTYLRLLREDCFAGLLQGIRSLRAGNLCNCDINFWLHVSTVGVHFNRNASPGLTFAISLPPTKGAKKSKTPLSGSLVCLFDNNGGFDLPIWGVVSRCEDDSNSKACICFVEIVGHQSGAETEELSRSASLSFQCARLIRGDDMVLVESPTYYRAYQPVLNALQRTDPHNIPFQDELVFVRWPDNPAPDYLKVPDATLDWSCIFTPKFPSEIREGIGAVATLPRRGYKTSFDPSQLKAVELAVNNRLTIIQGPPGTGKTYVGVRLLQLLMSASTFPKDSPVIVITFKNHALDQILEKCLKFCSGEGSLVRVGGRSKNKNLDTYNLFSKMTRKDEFSSDRAETIRGMERAQQDLDDALKDLNRCLLHFNPVMILEQASELHLSYFLLRATHNSQEMIDSYDRRSDELGFTLSELLQGPIPKAVDDPRLVADLLNFKQCLVAELRSWIPKPAVFQAAQAFFAMKKPTSIRTVPRDDAVAHAKNAVDAEGQDETRKEEEERRNAYETLRQDINLDDDKSDSKKAGWLANNFSALLKKKDVPHMSVAYLHLNPDIASQFDWLAYENPYDMSPEHRAIMVYKYWEKSVDAACRRLTSMKAQYDSLLQEIDQIEERRKLAVLKKAKIIGMTTSGAAINQSLLKYLSPTVILVEEAAEILEPQVLASLNSNLQHLILIGDHHQLRPQVESYDLERWHGFGVSMFERIVEHKTLPYVPLGLQCRMREEFVPMLLPIYPFLKSHTELVSGDRNKAPTCMVKTMHFWSHEYEETSLRSYVNEEEALMVVALARWIVSERENPTCLSILAAYNGQVTLIRKLLEKYPDLQDVEVHSIDRFQGAENEIVIVSLVRSNERGNIGHVSMRSRMCVAASRARCGVYFVGNPTTLAHKCAHWRTLISYFEDQNAISSAIPLCCPRHPKRPPYCLANTGAAQFEPKDVCDSPCQAVLPCGHACDRACHFGSHDSRSQCKVKVDFTFQLCGHAQTKMCCQCEEELLCKTVVMHEFRDCKHSTLKQCSQVTGTRKRILKCQVVCGKELQCGHICKLRCSDECDSAPCQSCQEIAQEKERIRKQMLIDAIASKQKELDTEIQILKEKGDQGIVIVQVHPDDHTAQAFFMAKDRAEKYIQPDCKTVLLVTKVERIENQPLQRKFLEAQRDLFNPLEMSEWLFYGGSDTVLTTVANKGFRAANKKAHLFDVYSSSTAQEHVNHTLLLCEVHLGKTWRISGDVEKELKKLNRKGLREKGYDSVSLVTNPSNEGEQPRPWKHAIFNPEQAIPRFVVSFREHQGSSLLRERKVAYIEAEGTWLEKPTSELIVLSYNVWFREDLELQARLDAIGDVILQHRPHIVFFQEVTEAIYQIFQRASWWKSYDCSVKPGVAAQRAYFCMQLSKLPVFSFRQSPFRNSVMGRELCLAEVDAGKGTRLLVATSHLESPCPAPPTWNQMFSPERVAQAKEAMSLLNEFPNVIFGGDMNWDDKKDGPPPLPSGWMDAWLHLRPGQDGFTYDTKANRMLSGNRSLQKRLDRMFCQLRDFKLVSIAMVGTEPIPDLTYSKEKKVRGQVQMMELPVLPSDHFGLLLKLSRKCA